VPFDSEFSAYQWLREEVESNPELSLKDGKKK
jgi:hypothetical protein